MSLKIVFFFSRRFPWQCDPCGVQPTRAHQLWHTIRSFSHTGCWSEIGWAWPGKYTTIRYSNVVYVSLRGVNVGNWVQCIGLERSCEPRCLFCPATAPTVTAYSICHPADWCYSIIEQQLIWLTGSFLQLLFWSHRCWHTISNMASFEWEQVRVCFLITMNVYSYNRKYRIEIACF